MIDLQTIESFVIDKSDWIKVKLSDVVFEPKESVKDPVAEGVKHVVGLEHIDSEDIHLRRSANLETSTTFTKKFAVGDVLFGRRRAYLKKAAQAEFEGICSGDITIMRATDMLMPELLPFLVNNDKFFDYAITHSAGGLSPRVKFKDLANFELTLPPINQQAHLTKLLLAMGTLIEQKSTLIPKTTTLISTIKKAEFERCHEEYISLSECGTWYSGGTPSRQNKAFWDGNIPWVSPKDMKSELISGSIETVTDKALEKGARLLPENAILVVIRGMILAHSFPVAITTCPVTFNQDMKALLVSDDFAPEYLLSYLQHNKNRVLAMTTTTTHGTKRLASDTLYSLPVPKQKRLNQSQFLSELAKQKSVLAAAETNVKQSKQLLSALISQVF
jgi:type I restriction enzyme S subunit